MVTVPSRSWVIFRIIKSAESRVHAAAEISCCALSRPGEFVCRGGGQVIELLPELFESTRDSRRVSDLAGPGGWPWS